PPDTEIDGDFFGTLEGQPDDVIGTYTGTANALIELAPHVAAFLLRAYGAQTAAQVELGTGVFGSFNDAPASLKSWRGSDWISGLMISEVSSVSTYIEDV